MQSNPVRGKKKFQDQQVDAVKIPAHSVEAEQSVLGGLMLDNQSLGSDCWAHQRNRFLPFRSPINFSHRLKL